jgi:hypothetical protein
MARKIAGGFGEQAAFALALSYLMMPLIPVIPACRAKDAAAPNRRTKDDRKGRKSAKPLAVP